MPAIKIDRYDCGKELSLTVLRPRGAIGVLAASALEKELRRLFSSGRYRLIMDLSEVEFISSAGWGIFISNIREARRNGGDLKLARMNASVREIYDLLEFGGILDCLPNVEEACSRFSTLPCGVNAGNRP